MSISTSSEIRSNRTFVPVSMSASGRWCSVEVGASQPGMGFPCGHVLGLPRSY